MITSPDVLNSNAWNHVVVTFDGTIYSAYANGLLVFSTNEFAGRVPFPTPVRYLARVNSYFAGRLDEVLLFNRALSSEEVRGIYLASTAGICRDQLRPLVVTQPSNVTAIEGTAAQFAVVAPVVSPDRVTVKVNGVVPELPSN